MKKTVIQGELFPPPKIEPGTVVVNDRVTFRTSDGFRVVFVGGLILHHYRADDRMAEAYAMVILVESGYADQNDIARAFGYTTRTLRRYQKRFDSGGLQALGRTSGCPPGSRSDSRIDRLRDRTILKLKTEGRSNRMIAQRLGLDEKTIRKRLRRLGWKSPLKQLDLFEDESKPGSNQITNESNGRTSAKDRETKDGTSSKRKGASFTEKNQLPMTFDSDPLNRFLDRALAALGLLDDAAPLFAKASRIPRAGVLIAIPAMESIGLVSITSEVYGSIGPAFFGLRTTVVAFVLLALMRINRPEALKEYSPTDIGRIIGLDRAPEVKTLRRKLTRLASMQRAEVFGRKLAQRRVAEHGKALGFLYVDGHVRVYHGKRKIPKAYVTRMRLAVPATTDYWVNDKSGEPLFVITADANTSMTKMLPQVLKEVRSLIGPRRRVTIVFDRGGWSPKLFVKMIADGFDILTYRKGRIRRIAEKRFIDRKTRIDGRVINYRLNDQPVRFLKGKLRLRQVTRLTDKGHQTPILTSRWDLSDIVVAYRMFERWRQENFFKYLRQEFLIDALVDYRIEPDDPTRSVPNPAWKEVDRELKSARSELTKLEKELGKAVTDNIEKRRPTIRGFKIAHRNLGKQIHATRERISKLVAKRASLEKRLPVSEVLKGQDVVKLATERKHLTNILKLVAYQVESALLNLLRPNYARIEEEGRTLLHAVFQSSASIEPTDSELRITIDPLSSPHRSKAVAALCEALNKSQICFPGTELRMHYRVAGGPS